MQPGTARSRRRSTVAIRQTLSAITCANMPTSAPSSFTPNNAKGDHKVKTRTSATLGLLVRETRDGDWYHVNADPVWIGVTPDDMRNIDEGYSREPIASDRIRNVGNQHLRAVLTFNTGNIQ